ncbi:MAG: alkaline shock response membrane anchor protein AmaP [Fusobacterium sp.]|uniref:alkaline shock response membrane anchor protein AmaP n=1 Tax=Fusobacterium sp. TaxID=68766 RepID=UPI0026DBC35B|nr:alkaline shock response membrane anchor protein AmaP [Fusobacterium sp.]MDO4689678.1 alkaline shock response membrane anchor protein AmaP [Fusobacterium sp.]
MLKKFIFFLAWIGILILSVLGINFILFPDEYIFRIPILTRLSIFELKIIFLSICVIYLFLVLYKFISLFERKKEYEKVTANGVVKISNTTINNYVLDLLKKDNEISNIKVSSERKGKKFYIYVKFQILEQLNVTNKIVAVQNLIKEELNNNIGIEVKEVIVNVSGLSIQQNKFKDSYSDNSNDTEVI